MSASGQGWRGDCFRTSMETFDAAYKKACASSQPRDWMDAALLAQQFRNVAYAVLTGEAPKQEPPASAGWVLVPRTATSEMTKAGDDFEYDGFGDYYGQLWAAMVDARPIPPAT